MPYNFDIDFVVTWVNGRDPAWIQEFNKYAPNTEQLDMDTAEIRYRDYGLLRYWFRGVEQFAPWVRKIHFVTCGQKPDWLDDANPKLHLVSHKDYISSQYLPLFSSNSIEVPMCRIPGLSEHFVYFNDDFFLTATSPRSVFFDANGLPKDFAVQNIISCDGASTMLAAVANNLHLLNVNFNKHAVIKKNPWKWFHPSYGAKNIVKNIILGKWDKFVGFSNPHSAQPYLKSCMEDCWSHCEDKFLETMGHRFRSMNDVSSWIFRYWHLCQGKFSPCNPYKYQHYYELGVNSTQTICSSIESQHFKSICINDGQDEHFEQSKTMLEESFKKILPEKSTFEK